MVCLHGGTEQDGVTGTVRVTVLYTPENESGVRALEFAMPFSAQGEGLAGCAHVVVETEIELLESRMLNPRKIFTRCKLVTHLAGCRKVCLTISSDAETDPALLVEKRIDRVIFTCGGTAGHVNPALALAQYMQERIENLDILFVGTVGEEGNGDIRGAKALFDGSRKIDAFVALDMETVARVQTGATGAHRWRLAVDGPGGHSWLDYGRVPSAVHAIGRAIAKIANLELPEDPKTSYTVGTIKGGTTVNTIAAHCEVDVDMRSVAMEELMKVEETILAAFEEAVAEENARWTKAPESSYVKLTKTKIGDRPAGQRPADCPAVNAALEGAKALGIEVTWTGSSSTDCNMPMSLGIPAVCLGTGGHTYNEHSLKEYFDSTDMHLGPQLALLTVLGITGLA